MKCKGDSTTSRHCWTVCSHISNDRLHPTWDHTHKGVWFTMPLLKPTCIHHGAPHVPHFAKSVPSCNLPVPQSFQSALFQTSMSISNGNPNPPNNQFMAEDNVGFFPPGPFWRFSFSFLCFVCIFKPINILNFWSERSLSSSHSVRSLFCCCLLFLINHFCLPFSRFVSFRGHFKSLSLNFITHQQVSRLFSSPSTLLWTPFRSFVSSWFHQSPTALPCHYSVADFQVSSQFFVRFFSFSIPSSNFLRILSLFHSTRTHKPSAVTPISSGSKVGLKTKSIVWFIYGFRISPQYVVASEGRLQRTFVPVCTRQDCSGKRILRFIQTNHQL